MRSKKPFQKPFKQQPYRSKPKPIPKTPAALGVRLNKFLANAGICSRREADDLIAMGMVHINGKVVTEMGYRVQPKDEVRYDGQRILGQKPVYVLLNKPKGFVATSQGGGIKKSVQELIQTAAPFSIAPMGDMGRPTTGLLFFTNDSKLRAKINASQKGVSMLYQVVLDKNLAANDLSQLQQPQQMYDQSIQLDKVAFVQGGTKRELGIEATNISPSALIKVFRQLGYTVQQLDRVVWAGLTKKDLPRGRWRHLTSQEVNRLQML